MSAAISYALKCIRRLRGLSLLTAPALLLLVCLHAAQAQEAGPHLTPPPMDITLLIRGIDPNSPNRAAALARFDEITTEFYQIDTNGNPVVDPVQSVQLKDPGGLMLMSYIVWALNMQTVSALPTWTGPNPLTVPSNFPTPAEITVALNILNQAQAGDENSLKAIQAAFAAYNYFEWVGLAPDGTHLITTTNPPTTVVGKTGQNIGTEALGFISGGTGKQALTTLALALEGDVNARKTVSLIFTYFPTCLKKPPFIAEPPRNPQFPQPSPSCEPDTSQSIYEALNNSLAPLAAADPSGALSNKTTAEILRAAYATPPNPYAQNALSLILSQYLDGVSAYPPQRGQLYIGPAAIEFLRSALSILPPPISSQRPPQAAPVPINESPVLGGGLHNIPSTGENTAPAPCTVKTEDIKLAVHANNPSPAFGTDPCTYTRDNLKLDFAQKFKAGEQFAAYMKKWTAEQWIPALKRMTAQWSATMIDQTRMIGSAIDAITAVKTAAKIQTHEVDVKMSLFPSDLACVGASALKGITYTKSVSHALSDALKYSIDLEASSGNIKGSGLPP